MRILIALSAASVVAIAAPSPADAREGCGPGFHRAWNGLCRANRGNREYVVGQYYQGEGYWYNNRMWRHRHRRNGVWIYL